MLEFLTEAIEDAGYTPGSDVVFAIDAAASELYDEDREGYYFPGESRMQGNEVMRTSTEMIAYYENLLDRFPIVSIEDGLEEEDWEGWTEMTRRLGNRVQLVGDDLFVTNKKRLNCGIRLDAANAILVKVNQIGTLTEALEAVEMAYRFGYRAIISHRSGETEDSFIADLAVACGSGQIKPVRRAGQTGMQNIISCCVLRIIWVKRRCMRILLAIQLANRTDKQAKIKKFVQIAGKEVEIKNTPMIK